MENYRKTLTKNQSEDHKVELVAPSNGNIPMGRVIYMKGYKQALQAYA
jgi:hypothetical protein